MELQASNQELLLLPRLVGKFQQEWKGPYNVIIKKGPVNYEVKQNCTKVVHINLLKKWVSRAPEDDSYMNIVEEDPTM